MVPVFCSRFKVFLYIQWYTLLFSASIVLQVTFQGKHLYRISFVIIHYLCWSADRHQEFLKTRSLQRSLWASIFLPHPVIGWKGASQLFLSWACTVPLVNAVWVLDLTPRGWIGAGTANWVDQLYESTTSKARSASPAALFCSRVLIRKLSR